MKVLLIALIMFFFCSFTYAYDLSTYVNHDYNMDEASGTGSLKINAWIKCNEAHLIGSNIHWMGKGFK